MKRSPLRGHRAASPSRHSRLAADTALAHGRRLLACSAPLSRSAPLWLTTGATGHPGAVTSAAVSEGLGGWNSAQNCWLWVLGSRVSEIPQKPTTGPTERPARRPVGQQPVRLSSTPAEPRPVQSPDEALSSQVRNRNGGPEGTHAWAPERRRKELGADPASSVCCCPSQQPRPQESSTLATQEQWPGRDPPGGPHTQAGGTSHRQMAAEPCSKSGLLEVMSSPSASEAEFHTLSIDKPAFLEFIPILILGLAGWCRPLTSA